MKKIINGKLYDTETAQELGCDGGNYGNFSEWHEELYRKRTGEFFLYGKGGPRSRYAQCTGNNLWIDGSKIIPLSVGSAREWAEEHLTADEYGEIFGIPDEDAEKTPLCVSLPANVVALARAKAAEEQMTLTAYVERALTAWNERE